MAQRVCSLGTAPPCLPDQHADSEGAAGCGCPTEVRLLQLCQPSNWALDPQVSPAAAIWGQMSHWGCSPTTATYILNQVWLQDPMASPGAVLGLMVSPVATAQTPLSIQCPHWTSGHSGSQPPGCFSAPCVVWLDVRTWLHAPTYAPARTIHMWAHLSSCWHHRHAGPTDLAPTSVISPPLRTRKARCESLHRSEPCSVFPKCFIWLPS